MGEINRKLGTPFKEEDAPSLWENVMNYARGVVPKAAPRAAPSATPSPSEGGGPALDPDKTRKFRKSMGGE